MRFAEQAVEKGPGALPLRGAEPDIGRIRPAVDLQPGGGEPLADDARVGHVIADHRGDLLPALRRIGGLCRALDDIGRAVELGGLAAHPHVVEADAAAHERAGDDRPAAAGAGEAGGFGEAAELDGAGLRARYLIDAAGQAGVGDVRAVGRVVEDDAAVLVGVVHPGPELLARGGHARGVVGEAEVDEVGHALRQSGEEAVLRRAGHVDDVRPLFAVPVPGAAGHGVGVDIDGVHGVADGHHAVLGEDVADVAAVALGPVGDEELVGRYLHAQGRVVVGHDGLAQEIIALIGAVAHEGGLISHLRGGALQRGDAGRRQGQRHVADAELDDVGLRVRRGEGRRAPRHLGEEVAAGEL